MGAGMLITSLGLMRYRSRLQRPGLWFLGSMVGGTGILALQGVAPTFLSLQILLFCWGLSGGFYMNLNQALIQRLAPHDRMGRVMSLNVLVNAGLAPVGALVAGLVASVIGPQPTLGLFGVVGLTCVFASLISARDLRTLRSSDG